MNIIPSNNSSLPRKQIEFKLESKPFSKVFLLAVDHSVNLLRSGNDIEEKSVLDDLRAYDGYKNLDELEVYGAPAYDDRYKDVGASNIFIITNAYDGRVDCFDVRTGITSPGNEDNDPDILETIDDFESIVRKNFSEIWIFDEIETDSEGIGIFESKLPDTVTSWDISGFTINKDYGLGIAKPQSIVVFQHFFLVVHLPYSIRLGEILRVDVTVFNYFDNTKPFEVDVRLYSEVEASADEVIADNSIETSDKNLLELDDTTEQPVEASTVESGFIFYKPKRISSVCLFKELEDETVRKMATNRIVIPPKTGYLTSFYIKASKAGERKFRIHAQVVRSKKTFDEVFKILKVEEDGRRFDKNVVKVFDLRLKNVHDSDLINFVIPEEAIKSSIRIEASVIGDFIGPALIDTKNLM